MLKYYFSQSALTRHCVFNVIMLQGHLIFIRSSRESRGWQGLNYYWYINKLHCQAFTITHNKERNRDNPCCFLFCKPLSHYVEDCRIIRFSFFIQLFLIFLITFWLGESHWNLGARESKTSLTVITNHSITLFFPIQPRNKANIPTLSLNMPL